MASTPAGRELTEAHRQEQTRLRAEFLALFLPLWELLDPRRLDDTAPGWLAAVLALIVPFRARSAQVSTNYFLEFRALEAPSPGRAEPGRAPRTNTPPRATTPSPTPRASSRPAPQSGRPPVPARRDNGVRWNVDPKVFEKSVPRRVRVNIPEIDWAPFQAAARTSLIVTGPVAQKQKAAAGKPLQVAKDESFVHSAGAASRHVLTGGRQSLLRLVRDDELSVGYIRVTDGDPCAFCAMLASRGVVYSSKRTFDQSNTLFDGPGEVKVHDNCACTLEPVYSLDAPWPGRAVEFRELWREVVGFAPNNRYSGKDAINAFRRAYEQRQRDARRTAVA